MSLAPLRQPGFRALWLIWLTANLSMWMNDVASTWRMASLTDSAFMVAMVQSASTLPLFLLGLPSGALADMVDRRRYLAWTQVWVGGVAAVLAALSFSDALGAPWLLACSFLNGIGMAMRWPLFAAIVPELVRRDELAAALALNGIASNLARIIGPIIAGALLASAGSGCVYLVNAVLSVVALVLILRWQAGCSVKSSLALSSQLEKYPERKGQTPAGSDPDACGVRVGLVPPAVKANNSVNPERLCPAMLSGLRYVMQSPQLRVILTRIFLFFLQSSALTALLPLLALRLDNAGPAAYTSLLVALAVGGVIMAFNLNRLRRHASRDWAVGAGICLHAASSVTAALAPSIWLAVLAMAVSGMAWIATANSLTVAMQLALPDWVRARGMSIYLMAVMGGSAAGAALWGYLASLSSLQASVGTAAGGSVAIFLLTKRYSVGNH